VLFYGSAFSVTPDPLTGFEGVWSTSSFEAKKGREGMRGQREMRKGISRITIANLRALLYTDNEHTTAPNDCCSDVRTDGC